jgi:hypothetical protein
MKQKAGSDAAEDKHNNTYTQTGNSYTYLSTV